MCQKGISQSDDVLLIMSTQNLSNFYDKAIMNLKTYLTFEVLFASFPPHLTSVLSVFSQWLNEEKVIQRLVDMVQPSQDEDVSFSHTSLFLPIATWTFKSPGLFMNH